MPFIFIKSSEIGLFLSHNQISLSEHYGKMKRRFWLVVTANKSNSTFRKFDQLKAYEACSVTWCSTHNCTATLSKQSFSGTVHVHNAPYKPQCFFFLGSCNRITFIIYLVLTERHSNSFLETENNLLRSAWISFF